MVKSGQAWAGTFVTLDATGALEAGTPSGVLYVDGVADAATVTISGSNPYKFAVTLPTLTAGQRVDMYITATIDTIATAGIVASEQADTTLLSDGVTLADDAITAAKFDESTAFPVKSQDSGATALARTGADSDTLETLSDEIAAVKAETALIVEDTGTTIPGTITTIDNEIAVIDGIVDSILEDTGTTIPGTITTIDNEIAVIDANVDAILADTGTDGVVLTSGAVDAILDEVVVGTYTMRQILTVTASALAGKLSGGGTTTLTFRGINDASDVIVATVDANGNRSAVTVTV